MRGTVLLSFLLLILAASLAPGAASGEAPRWPDIRPGYGVSEQRWLSHYLPALQNTPGDTPVYILRGARPGGVLFVNAGTHGDEIAGIMAAIWLVEKAQVTQGTLIVVPRANNSASTYHDANRPAYIALPTAHGDIRRFAYGARRTNPLHQAPDPLQYIHVAGGVFAGEEARNLDRVHPGKADGSLTEMVSYALVRLLQEEQVDIAVDLHEAGPTSRLADMLVAHPRALDLAAEAILDLELTTGYAVKLEVSAADFPGLSHREWGDHTPALSFLTETPNPGQLWTDAAADPVDGDPPLALRVAHQLQILQALAAVWSSGHPGREICWPPVPDVEAFTSQPLGYQYND